MQTHRVEDISFYTSLHFPIFDCMVIWFTVWCCVFWLAGLGEIEQSRSSWNWASFLGSSYLAPPPSFIPTPLDDNSYHNITPDSTSASLFRQGWVFTILTSITESPSRSATTFSEYLRAPSIGLAAARRDGPLSTPQPLELGFTIRPMI